MKLPAFSDFLESLDPDKLDYDLGLYMPEALKQGPTALNNEEYALVIRTCITTTKLYLSAYHQWLNEQLSEENLLD